MQCVVQTEIGRSANRTERWANGTARGREETIFVHSAYSRVDSDDDVFCTSTVHPRLLLSVRRVRETESARLQTRKGRVIERRETERGRRPCGQKRQGVGVWGCPTIDSVIYALPVCARKQYCRRTCFLISSPFLLCNVYPITIILSSLSLSVSPFILIFHLSATNTLLPPFLPVFLYHLHSFIHSFQLLHPVFSRRPSCSFLHYHFFCSIPSPSPHTTILLIFLAVNRAVLPRSTPRTGEPRRRSAVRRQATTTARRAAADQLSAHRGPSVRPARRDRLAANRAATTEQLRITVPAIRILQSARNVDEEDILSHTGNDGSDECRTRAGIRQLWSRTDGSDTD